MTPWLLTHASIMCFPRQTRKPITLYARSWSVEYANTEFLVSFSSTEPARLTWSRSTPAETFPPSNPTSTPASSTSYPLFDARQPTASQSISPASPSTLPSMCSLTSPLVHPLATLPAMKTSTNISRRPPPFSVFSNSAVTSLAFKPSSQVD